MALKWEQILYVLIVLYEQLVYHQTMLFAIIVCYDKKE